MTTKLPTSRRRAATRKQRSVASYRVNARLDAESREKLSLLEMQTGLSTSDVLREAVSVLFAKRVAVEHKGRASLDALVGKFHGAPADLAENYKRYLGDSLADKHKRS